MSNKIIHLMMANAYHLTARIAKNILLKTTGNCFFI